MKYESVYKAVFLQRQNRFIAHCLLDGREVIAHVPNTGRCAELFLPGCTVYLQKSDAPHRKTPYTLFAVENQGSLVNIHSQAPNTVAAEFLQSGRLLTGMTSPASEFKRECTFGNSRFDLRFTHEARTCYMEVKGVTLRENGIARFPDAPTERGVKHVQELVAAAKQGFGAYLLFVIQMNGVTQFSPNDTTHPAFGQALREAAAKGVILQAYDCIVTPNQLTLHREIPVIL